MTPTVSSSALVSAATLFPVIPPVQICPYSQSPKRYLKDFPDSAKTHVPERKITQIRDDFGNILEIEEALKDRIVLEDPSETRLQKLARVCVLINHSTPQYVALLRSMGTEFPQEDVNTAIQAVYDEIHALYPPKVREASALFVQILLLDRHNRDLLNKLDAMPRRKVTPWDVFCSFGDDILDFYSTAEHLYSTAEKNYPRVVTGVKVAAVATLVFFFYVYNALHLYNNHRSHNPL